MVLQYSKLHRLVFNFFCFMQPRPFTCNVNSDNHNYDTLATQFQNRMTPRADFNLSRNRDDYIMDLLRYPDITTISTVYSLQPKFNSFKIFGVGLSRTGTHSLADYFHMCNLTVINSDFKDTQYLPNHSKNSKQFIYDDVHVVLGLPTALNYSEVLKVYPQAKFISTYRDPEKWYDSMQNYVDILKVELFGSIGIPLHLRYLFKSAYGTYLPDHDVWIRSYIAHYESVRRFIPAGQLLELQTDQLSEPISAKKLWAFLEIEPPGYITSIPHSNKLSTMRDSIARGIGSGKLTNIPKFPFTIYRRSATARSSYAYSSLISEPTNNDTFKWNFAMASIVLCKSIRDTYVGFDPKKKYDMVLLVIGSISKSIGDKLLSCYDRLFSVPYFANGPRSIVDNNYNAVIRSKFWTLGLTEYNRVQFIDSDHLVIRNLDHYFFRGYYDERRKHKTTFASRKCYKPKRIYCQYNLFAPASTGFMSIEPSKQALLDIKSIYDFGNWDFKEGWMGYGLFDFNVSEYSRSFVNTQEKTSWLQGTDPKFSFVPIFKNIPTTILQWKQSTWRFYCSWSDQGIAFYYFFVLKQIGGLIDHTDQSHEMIHFVGENKPWIPLKEHKVLNPNTQKNEGKAWKTAMDLWNRQANALNIKLVHDFEDVDKQKLSKIVDEFRSSVFSMSLDTFDTKLPPPPNPLKSNRLNR